jgi:4-hydroxythreonine-4-phosphate dehydrogenase
MRSSEGRRIVKRFSGTRRAKFDRSLESLVESALKEARLRCPNGDLPAIGMTMGDPGGIGPEVALKAACDPRVRAVALPVIVGDGCLVRRIAGQLGFRIDFIPAHVPAQGISRAFLASGWRSGRGSPGFFVIINTAESGRSVGRGRPVPIGKPSKRGGLAAGRAIEEAVRLSISGMLDGMVTAPVSKQSLSLAGYGMIGHTELVAKLTKTKHYAMMMKSGPLRVVLATTHVPLSKVAASLTSRDLVEKMKLTYEYLVWYTWLKRPRIAVCGLNPHAGEGGMLGKEERSTIAPAVRRAAQLGIRVEGPLSADSVFRPDQIGRYDAVVAMYHDQGIIPIKMDDPGGVVNITLGIPIVRTSPGHGTAFDIAGKGVASEESMVTAAIECAEMAKASPAASRKGSSKVTRTAAPQMERVMMWPSMKARDKIARALRKNAGFLKDDR